MNDIVKLILAIIIAIGLAFGGANLGETAALNLCSSGSIDHFYGFSVGKDYLYWQTDDHVMDSPRFLRLERGKLNIVQFDIFAIDNPPIYHVTSNLTPFESLARGDMYASTKLDFQGLFWRHMILEARLGGWHLWELNIGTVGDQGLESFCDFEFLVFFFDAP